MQIHKAEFRCSSERISQVPKDSLKDIAFIGRSNVGKSSLINMLTGRQGLAKVSGTPGKTRLINHFPISELPYPWSYFSSSTSRSRRGRAAMARATPSPRSTPSAWGGAAAVQSSSGTVPARRFFFRYRSMALLFVIITIRDLVSGQSIS